MSIRIEVKEKSGFFDAVGQQVKKSIIDLGITTVDDVFFVSMYRLIGSPTERDIHRIAREILIDPVSQEYCITSATQPGFFLDAKARVAEIALNAGVMDPVEDSALKAIRDIGIASIRQVHTSKKYVFTGSLTPKQLATICEKLLYNKTIEHVVEQRTAEHEVETLAYSFNLVTVDILRASDKQLMKLSREGQLFLNLTEMKEIQLYFKKIGRNPTDCELETIAQTWSEHCGHKTFRGNIKYSEQGRGAKKKSKLYRNLLKSTIMKATKELKRPWCVSVFQDNSGVITFDKKHDICFKVETHNHPSALEPFGGANTGVGGVIRDVLGTGLAARPIFNTDVFCFGPIDYPAKRLPIGTLHPKRIMKGVVSGVRDYGNKMGIPTVNGAVLFDKSFVGNPLVYCGTAGIMPKGKAFKKVRTGDLIVALGGRTGRDGIHGATFSSGELMHESETLSGGAVQIGNPITEKRTLDAIMKARDKNLFTAITDCGAGGFSSAVGEMGSETGVRVDLEKAPLKYQGLSYTEIWISEAQERMVLSVPKKSLKRLEEICAVEEVALTVIGEFTKTKRLELFYEGNQVCDIDMNFLHDGVPKLERKAIWSPKYHAKPKLTKQKNYGRVLKNLLAHPNIASKEWIIRQYDHEVQGGSVLKPLTGVANDGPSDAAIVRPLFDSRKGVIVSNGINFRYGFIDPYWMAASCIDEALRQIVAVGGSLKEVALLDNFCWGNPDKPDRLAGIVRASQACYDFAKYYRTPFISGKDSLNNEYVEHGRSMPIAGTLLISALSVMEDIGKTVSLDLKKPGNLLYGIGETYDELGGSCYYDLLGAIGDNVPKINKKISKKTLEAINKATQTRLLRAAHDCSEGGIAVAAAEMSFAGGFGAEVFLAEVPRAKSAKQNETILFSESNSRFIVEVEKKNQKKFEALCKGLPIGLIGCVSERPRLKIYGLDCKPIVDEDIAELKESWQKTLRF